MRTFSLHVAIVALLVGLALASGDYCTANNCLRQVRATENTMASSDCSSYLARSTTTITVTPGFRETVTASTSTKTVKVTSTKTGFATSTDIILSVEYVASVSTVIIPGKKRDAAATKTIPTYASSCTAEGQYASACSCLNVGPAFTRIATAHSVAPITITKTLTTTISTTITASKTTIEPSTSTRIHTIQATITIPAIGTPFDGYYITTVEDTDTLLETSLFTNDPFALPSFFTLSGGNLYQDTYVAVASVNDYNYLSFQSGIADNDPTRLGCTATEASGILRCSTKEGGLSVFYGCLDESGEEFPQSLYFYPPGSEGVVPYGCYPVQFKQILAT